MTDYLIHYIWVNKTSLTPSLFIEVSVRNRNVCGHHICSFMRLFYKVPTAWYLWLFILYY
jgi:hypothetical protein